MKINITSVFVDDQREALQFYTEVLGFEKRAEIPLGEAAWLTVVHPNNPKARNFCWSPVTIRRLGRSERR